MKTQPSETYLLRQIHEKIDQHAPDLDPQAKEELASSLFLILRETSDRFQNARASRILSAVSMFANA